MQAFYNVVLFNW